MLIGQEDSCPLDLSKEVGGSWIFYEGDSWAGEVRWEGDSFVPSAILLSLITLFLFPQILIVEH